MILRRKTFSTDTPASKLLSKMEKRRALRHELLEERRLLAFGPQLLGIDHNNGVLIQDGSIHNTAPRELTFRFDEGQILDRATLGGIRLFRSGFDGVFDNGNDVTINPAFLDLGQSSFSVVMRFNETLIDDLYRVQIVGRGTGTLRNTAGLAFGDRTMDNVDNGQNYSSTFDLQLGAQVISVVPQPITRDSVTGVLSQAKDKIEVYFNSDKLNPAVASQPAYYRLINTQDQSLLFPQTVSYDATNDRVTLNFAQDLSTATYRLQIGASEESNSTATTAVNLGALSQQARAANYDSPIRRDANGNVVPTIIPDGGPVVSGISVVDSFLISDLNVEVDIDHEWGPDLRVFLQGPGGQRVEMIRDVGSQVLGGQIYGVKYNDLNRNGRRDDNEPGVPGWTIFIDVNANGELDPGERNTVTDAQGRYSFVNLALNSTYQLVEVPQPLWTTTQPLTSVATRLYETDFSNGARQTITISGNPTQGNFRLGFAGRATSPIVFAGQADPTTTASNIQQALAAILDPGQSASVVAQSGLAFVVDFSITGVGSAYDQPALIVVDNQLNSGQIGIGNVGDASGFTSAGTNNLWHLSNGRGNNTGHTPEFSFYFGQNETVSGGGTYLNNADATLRSPEIDLTDPTISGPIRLRLNHRLATESGFDFAEILVVADGQETSLLRTDVSTTGFEALQFDLSRFAGKRVQLLFKFTSDGSVTAEGWYIDDVRVEVTRTSRLVSLGTGPQQQLASNVDFGSSQRPQTGPDAFGYTAFNVPSTVIFQEGFESGSLGPQWTTSSSTVNGRVAVSNSLGTPANSGSFHLIMDTTVDGINNRNEAILTVDLSGIANPILSFWHKDINDEENALPASFSGSADGDGVSISADGVNWHTLISPFNTGSAYTQFSFDLGAAAAAANIALGPNFRIKFQQFDNFMLPTDGRTFDDIQIAVPRFEDITSSATAKRILQQFTDVGQAWQIGGIGDELVNGMTADAAGNFYVTGSFQGTVDFDFGPGSTTLTSAGGNDIFVAKYSSAGNLLWARQAGGSGSDVATAVVVDGAGNVIVSGSFSGTATLGATNLTSNGSTDAFLWKLNSAGTSVWAHGLGSTAVDEATGVDVLANGDVVATGYFSGTVDFNPGAAVSNQTSAGSTDIFVLRLTAAGNFTWVRRIGGTDADRAEDVQVTAAGNVVTTGSFNGTVDFNPATGAGSIANLTSVGAADGFVQQMTGAGAYQWAQRFGNAAASDRGNALASDSMNHVYVTGVDNGDIHVSRFDATGAPQWSRTFGSSFTDIGQAIEVAADGRVLVAGSFRGTVNFGQGDQVSAGGADVFILGLTPQGAFSSVNAFGGTLDESATALRIEDADSFLVAGTFRGNPTLNVGTSQPGLVSNGGVDGFIARVATPVGLDDGAVQLTSTDLSGFAFPFYGTTYNTLFVSSNGLITFGAPNASAANTNLLTAPSEAAIAAFWEDLRTGAAQAEAVFWEVLGTGIDQRLVIQWSNVRVDNANAAAIGPLDFQAILSERDGSIELNYRRVTAPQVIPAGPAQTVGTFTKGVQESPAIAADAAGNYVVVWNSPNQDQSGAGIYGRRYSSAGVPLGNEFLINETTIGDQSLPQVAMNSSGRFVVAWQGAGPGDTAGIFARVYSPAGVSLVDEFLVHQSPTGTQALPAVGIDDAGDFVVAWSGQGASDTSGIFARVFNASGQPQGVVDEIQRIRFLGPPNSGSSFTLFHNGEETAAIAYTNVANTTAQNIRDELRALNGLGDTLNVVALATADEVQQLTLSNVPAGGGSFVLEFEGQRTAPITLAGATTAANIQAALVALTSIGAGNVTVTAVGANDTQYRVTFVGALAGTDVPLLVVASANLGTETLNVTEVTAGATNGRDFEVRFLGVDGGIDQPTLVHGNRLNGVTHTQITTRRDGSNGEFRANNQLTGNQQTPNLDMTGAGAFTLTWSSAGQDGNLLGVFGKRFDASGAVIAPELDEVQRLTLDGPPNANSNFRLRLGGTGGPTTGNIVYVGPNSGSQTATRIQTALRALPGLADVVVSTTAGVSNEIQRLTFTAPTPANGTFRLAHRGLITAPIVFAGTAVADAATTATNIENALRALANAGNQLTVVPVVVGGNNNPFQFTITFTGVVVGGIDHPPLALAENQLNQGSVAITTIDDGGKSQNEFIVTYAGAAGRRNQPALELANAAGGVTSITVEEVVRGVGSEFQANVEVNGDQIASDVAIRADGSYFIVWSSAGQDGDGTGVFGKLLNAAGDVLRDEFQINTFTQSLQSNPKVDSDALGNLIVTWDSAGQDGDSSGVYARRIGADGFPLGDEFRINTLTAGAQVTPSIAVNTNGTFVVAWRSTAGQGGIHAQQFAANGTAIGVEQQISQFGVPNQTLPQIAQAPNGNYVIVWADNTRDADNSVGVYAQLFNAAGSPLTAEFQVNQVSARLQTNPEVAMDGSGRFTIVWSSEARDARDQAFSHVYARRFDATGSPLSPEFQVSITPNNSNEDTANIDIDPVTGNTFVVWDSFVTGTGRTVRGRILNASGVPLTNELLLANLDTALIGAPARVAASANGSFTIVWTNVDSDTFDYFLNARRFDGAGNPLTNVVQINPEGVDGDSADIDTDSNGNTVIVWSASGVNLQRFDAQLNPLSQIVKVSDSAPFDPLPRLALASDDSLAVTWVDSDTGGITAQRIAADGTLIGPNFPVSELRTLQSSPVIIAGAGGSVRAAWIGSQTGSGVYTRAFTSDLASVGIKGPGVQSAGQNVLQVWVDGSRTQLVGNNTSTRIAIIQQPLARVFAVNSTSNQLLEIHSQTGATLRSYPLPTPSGANAGVAYAGGTVYYVPGNGSALYKLDPDTGGTVGTLPLSGVSANGLAGVAYLNGEVVLLDATANRLIFIDPFRNLETRRVTPAVALQGGLTGAGSRGTLFAINNQSQILEINPATGAVVATLASPGTGLVGLGFVNGELIASNATGTATRLNPTTGAVLGSLTVAAGLSAIGADDEGRVRAAVGGNYQPFVDTILDDEATVSITEGIGPYTGKYRPVEALSGFDGTNVRGTWRLEVRDTATNNEGVLHGWRLLVNDPKDTPPDAQHVGFIGDTLDAAVGAANDVDIYRFELLTGGTITLATLPTAGLNAAVRLFDAQGNQLVSVDAAGVGAAEQLVYVAANAGVFYVGISSSGNTAYNILNGSGATGGTSMGSYSIELRFSQPIMLDDDNSSFDTATLVGVVGVGEQRIRAEIRSEPYGPELPGANDEPGHRDIPPETHLNASGGTTHAPHRVIMRFQDGVSPQRQAEILAEQGLSVLKRFDFIGAVLVRTQPGTDVILKTSQLDQLPEVRYATPDYQHELQVIPDDPLFPQQWHYDNQGQSGGTFDADIDLPEAWDITTGSSQTVIAILDSGVQYTHPDLAANMWVNPGETAGDGIDNDGNGYIDDVYGIDPGEGDSDPMDTNGHGTHVAGTTAAVGNNGLGVTGVNWNAKIMALKVGTAAGGIPDSAVIEALNYLVTMKTVYGINIVVSNNSYGGAGFSQATQDAIAASINVGIPYVAAAGNFSANNDVTPFYPASYPLDGIISVAASDDDDLLAGFSHFGLTSVDVAAPGVDILSTTLGGGFGLNSGTSMASPHVAGVVALLAGFNPQATVDQLKSAIMLGADPLPNLTGTSVSGARLNAAQALTLLGGSTGPSGSAILTAFYNFQDIYGVLPSGAAAVNGITEIQKQRTREIMEMFSQHLGIQFIETANEGLTVITGDLRAIDPTVQGGPGGVAGISEGSLFGRVVMDAAENWGDSEYGGSWFQVAMHEIGHSLGLGHTYDLPNLTIMGGFGGGEPVFPGDHDLVHGKHLLKPASIDQDLYQFTLTEDGMFSAETIAERLAPNASLLDTVISVYRQVSGGRRELVARNDDYFSNDSYLNLHLTRGTYFVGVSAAGNKGMNPSISDTGFGGTSQGDYELVFDFKPNMRSTLVDTDGVAVDGDADGTPGGEFNFYFESGPTIFVDKLADTTPGTDGNGSLATPLDNIRAATELARSRLVMPHDGAARLADGEFFLVSDGLNPTVRFEFDDNGSVSVGSVAVRFTADMSSSQLAAAINASITATVNSVGANAIRLNVTSSATAGIVNVAGTTLLDASGSPSLMRSPNLIRIVGNGGADRDVSTLNDNRPYLVGLSGGAPLADGDVLQVPQGVTVMVDAGALFKMRQSNIDVGTSSVGVDRSQGALQILGTPRNRVVFDSLRNDALGGDTDGPGGLPQSGDWGGIVFRGDSDQEQSGVFLNWVNHTNLVNGGGKVLVQSVEETFTPIHLIDSRPSISHNSIRRSADAAISADPASFNDTDGRIGPDIYHNSIVQNSINGLFVRIRTQAGSAIDRILVPSRWDDIDVVHVLTENLLISGSPGGPIKNAATGLISARLDGSLKIDPGVVVKLEGARIETLLGAQLIAEGTQADPVIFTTLSSDAYGGSGTFDTKNDVNATLPAAGQWGGLFFAAASHGSLDHVLLDYAGGLTPIEGGFDRFNALEIHQADVRLTNSIVKNNASGASTGNRSGRGSNAAATIFVRGAQPVIVNNLFQDNLGTVVHINANSLQAVRNADPGRSTGPVDQFVSLADNYGPMVRLNRLQNNGINGMEVRSATLTTESVWDDTDIAHILRGEISVLNHHTFSGLHLLSSESESLVVKLAGANAGFTVNGTLLDIDDRIGGSIYIGASGRPVVLTALEDDSAIAGVDFFGQPLGDTNNNGPSTGTAGAWRGILLDRFSNDRNVALARETEPAFSGSTDINRSPSTAQFLGNLSPNEKSGDINRRLGFEVYGNISVDNSRDLDVYSFTGVAGTEVYFDLDQTGFALDSILELIDATGRVLARSINSSVDGLSGLALPLNRAAHLGHDFYSISERDAGMRVLLPGTAGQTNTYFVRVRSNPSASVIPPINVENLNGGLTSGEYKLQIRLRQVDEKPGSFIRGADIRFATNGIQVIGLPGHSPLLGESVETRAGNDSQGAAQPLGNLLTTDRNTLSLGGNLSTSTDVDWYSFELDYNLIQSIGGFNSGTKTFSTIFDIDYADGIARADTVLSVFDAAGNLVLVSRDSNVEDDQPAAGQGASASDLTRGSFGTQDSFIGSVQMPAGSPGSTTTYYVAVSSNSQLPSALNGTFTSGASSTLVRLEPISGLSRIAEDHIGFAGYLSGNFNRPVPVPPETSLFDIANPISLSANVVPFTLNDIVLYTAQPGNNGLKTVNPFTGTQWTNVGNLPTQGPGRQVTDLAMRSDGRLFMIESLAGAANTAGRLVELDPATGAATVIGNDSIPDIVAATNPPDPEQLTSPGLDAFAWLRTGVAQYDLYYSVQGGRRGAGVDNASSTLYRADPANGSAAAAQGQPWGRRGEIFQNTPGDLGRTTGMAFVNGTLFGVSNLGFFYQISVGSGAASNVVNLGSSFSGLALGPQNAEGGRFANMLFATTSTGSILALDTSGNLQSVFSSGTSATTGGAPVGLAFSVLDFNLWHPTMQRRADAGHGINQPFDQSRTPSAFTIGVGSETDLRQSNQGEGGASFYFGFENWQQNPVGANAYIRYNSVNSQYGILQENLHRDMAANPLFGNTYNLPGGAMGSLATHTVSLAGYDPADKPTIYFNYFLATENQNTITTSEMRDSARVLVSRDGGATWELLATNNSILSTAALTGELPRFISPNVEASSHPRQQVQELFDNSGGWRQARIDLSNYAGQAQLQFRFDFTTAGAMVGVNGAQPGDPSRFGSLFDNRRGQNNSFEGFYIDDVIIGFAERGEMVTGPAGQTAFFTIPQNPNPGDPSQILVGQYQLEIRRGTEYGANIDNLNPNIYIFQSLDTNDRLVGELFRLGDRNLFRDQGQVLIANNSISDSSQFGIVVDAGARDAGGSLSRPGGVRNLPTINNERLTTGVVIENNIVAAFGQGGIRFSGDPNAGTTPLSAVPFGRIQNNTVYGGDTSNGVGIEVTENASPTILNNIIANTVSGLSIDGSSTSTVVGANLFQGNTNNGVIGVSALVLAPADPLFVNAAQRNFYPARGSFAIDSSLNSLADRPSFEAVNAAIGIPPSPILAPERDRFNQLRLDDPAQDPPPGLGSNIFKDRGAVERADFTGPNARLIEPLDNDGLGLDLNPIANEVLVQPTTISQIVIQLLDQGIGVDDNTVTPANVQVRLDGMLLVNGTDYEFVYNATNNLIILRALRNNGPVSNRYDVRLNNNPTTGIRDLANNTLSPNLSSGTTDFVIITDGKIEDSSLPPFTLASGTVTALEDNERETRITPTVVSNFARNLPPLGGIGEPVLVFTTVSNSNAGLFSVAPAIDRAGNLSFVTAADQVGSAVLVMRLRETGVANPRQTPPQTFTITLTPVNDAPFLSIPNTLNVNEDQGAVQLSNFAVDLGPGPVTAVDEASQTISIVTTALDPSIFTIQPTIDALGTLRFQTRPEFNSSIAPVLVTVQVTDNGSNVAPNVNRTELRTFTIAVAPVNDPPTFTLTNSSITVVEDEEQFRGIARSEFPGFASNIAVGPASAVDEASQTATFNVTTDAPALFSQQPAIDASGKLTFRTASNRNGIATVVVQLQDSGPSAPAPNQNTSNRATFTISIAPINDAPEFTLVSSVTSEEDAGLQTVPNFAADIRRGPLGTTDENSQQVAFEVIADNPSAFIIQPVISIDGTLSYQTALNANSANANFGFTVRLRDSGLSAPPPNNNLSTAKSFTLTVTSANDPPVADAFNINGIEDTPLAVTVAAVLAGDLAGPTLDEFGQALRITQVEQTTAQGGNVTVTLDPVDPTRIISLNYQPALDFVGIDTVRYVVTDNGNPERSGTGTISITVAGINDAPRFTRGVDQQIAEDSPLTSVANWATGILAGPVSALDELANQTVSFTAIVDRPELFQVQPTVSSNGTLSFQPAKDANGIAKVVVTAVDSGSGTTPNINTSAAQTFTINIAAVNDAPVFTPGANVNVAEDSGPYSLPWATSIAPAAGINASPATAADEANQVVSFTVTADKPGLFSVQPKLNSQGLLEFTPAANAVGVAIVSISAVDTGSGTAPDVNRSQPSLLTITIGSQNDAPVANGDSYTTDEDTFLSIAAPGLLSNDSDVDLPQDTLTVVVGNIVSDLGATVTVSANGAFTYDPKTVAALQQLTNGQSISDTFVYKIRDAAGLLSENATVTIAINGVDDPPTAVNDNFSIGVGQSRDLNVLTNDSDVDSTIDPRTVVIKANPGFGSVSVSPSGVVTYTPEGGFRGNDSFRYTVKDTAGNESNEAIVSLLINSAPVASNDSAFTFKGAAIDINVLANDRDIDGAIDPATVQIEVSPGSSGVVEVLPSGLIRFRPATGFFGDVQFAYSVRDNSGTPSNPANVNVRVQNSRWQNPQDNLDVNSDGFVSPIDALLLINYLNGGGERFLPASGVTPQPFLDPTGDEFISPLDVLSVINFLNENSGRGQGEGEGSEVLETLAPTYAMLLTPTQVVELSNQKLARESISLAVEELLPLIGSGVKKASQPVAVSGIEPRNQDRDELIDLLSAAPEPIDTSIDDAIQQLFSGL